MGNSNLDKSDKRLIAKFTRRKKSWKMHWTMPTKPMLKLTNPSRDTKDNSVKSKEDTKKKREAELKSPRRLDLLTAKLMPFKENLRNLALFWTLLTVARNKLKWILPRPA